MSTPAVTATDTYVTPTFWSLLRAELLRVRSRRFVWWSALVLLGLMLLVGLVQLNNTASYTDAQVRQAIAACDEVGGDGVADTTVGPAVAGECTVADAVSVGAFAGDPPAYRAEIADWAMLVGLAAAAFAFILGATFGGADWAQRTMPALLFWEPRRIRVYAAKLLALVLGATVFFVAAQLVWLAISAPIYAVHGVWDDGFGSVVGPTVASLARTWLLTAVFGSVAFGIACLTRNTGAALGAGFVYFAVFETFIAFVFVRAQDWLLLVNIGALMTPGGIDEEGMRISAERGALVLVGYAVIVNVLACTLFRRRDLT